ncbi:MAG: hypothetical protein NTU60_04500 [Candidatus Aminicenantes bacterium]|nr:hypothetical protein [Candidatus Aminicenantes bacterium]
MSEEKGKVVAVTCPCCHSLLWVEASTGSLVKSEKAAKKKESLDDLLLKEKKKKDGFATKFEETAELEKKKFETAKEKFAKAFEKLDDE